jgi:hypothetical protein
MSLHECKISGCGRTFIDPARLQDHAEAVHSFNDIERLLGDTIREAYGREANALTGQERNYVWVVDVADDWVVFQVESANDCNLYKASYTISADNVVTLGKPVEVVRKTVYDPIAPVAGTEDLVAVAG